MSKAYQYIIENVTSGKIDKQIAVELVKRIKADELVPFREIAIIGMAAYLPEAVSTGAFWQHLRNGADLIGEFPAVRQKDLLTLFPTLKREQEKYNPGAYLPQVAHFDPAFFRLSPREASLMDPNQRFFLQTAWSAVEDAGYGGKKLQGTRTGIFVGFSSDFGLEYKTPVQYHEELVSLSYTGNIRSIIASRLAYILDLKGPSMVVDTACSSSLVAVHLACEALRKKECELAIAGGVKINLAPISGLVGVGVESPTWRAKTFDDSADGTALGEGVTAIILKPLEKALVDRDVIYGVIKGSAINQDGNTIGITAPNALAQADVIERAWKDAGVDPESISYIEAHGTGTKLGDPIEIEGITRAFRKYTTKKQFCGIGSVKSNLGHLDHASGIVGLLKAVLALKHRELPPSLHFARPNHKVNFADSPVYVVDLLQKWERGETPLRCGVSSFGLSGTNCHLVLEEAPERKQEMSNLGVQILPLSGRSRDALLRLVGRYLDWLGEESEVNLRDLCYTAATGRDHYTHRAVLLFTDVADLQVKLERLRSNMLADEEHTNQVYYGEHRVLSQKKAHYEAGELGEEARRELTRQASDILVALGRGGTIRPSASEGSEPQHPALPENKELSYLMTLAQLYVAGASVEWEQFYTGEKRFRVSLPTYPFEEQHCWLESIPAPQKTGHPVNTHPHPLFDCLLAESLDRDIYTTTYSVERQWELREHKVTGFYVLPGTTYVEIGREVARRYYPEENIRIHDLVFLAPLSVSEGEAKEVQTIVRKESSGYTYLVTSRTAAGEGDWVTHAHGKISAHELAENPTLDLSALKGKCTTELSSSNFLVRGPIETGPRWRNVKQVWIGEDELLLHLALPEEYTGDVRQYGLHPALLDIAVNAANQSVGEGLYLPFSYKEVRLHAAMPGTIYSHLRKKSQHGENHETFSFDITLLDAEGRVFAQIEDYTIKKVHDRELRVNTEEIYYQLGWVPAEPVTTTEDALAGGMLIFKDTVGLADSLIAHYRSNGVAVFEVTLGEEYQQLADNRYIISGREEDYTRLCSELVGVDLKQIIHLQSITRNPDLTNLADFTEAKRRGVDSLFYLTRALIQQRFTSGLEIVLVGQMVHSVTGCEECLHPEHAALFGLGKVLQQEHAHFHCRAIDIDPTVTAETLIASLQNPQHTYQMAYRNGQRWCEEFQRVNWLEIPEAPTELSTEGVYLITGGTGSLGLAVSKYLALQHPVRLALLSRSALPPEAEWEQILANGEASKLSRQVAAIRELRELGAEVKTMQVDISQHDELAAVLTDLRARYGRISGVIHCAGAAGDGFMMRKDYTTFAQVLAPKLEGTWLLDQLTREDQPDFWINFSSIIAIFGAPGQSDYTAANAYLDAFAGARSRAGLRTVTINWPAWRETGMAHDYGYVDENSVFKPVGTAQGIRAFGQILGGGLARVVVGELNYSQIPDLSHFPIQLSNELKLIINRRRNEKPLPGAVGQAGKSVQVQVTGKAAGFSEVEMKLATIWARVLGVDEVNIYESFFELGGDSILATHLLQEVEKEFPGQVDITDIFNYLTIAELAQYLNKRMHNSPEETEDEMDAILDQLMKGQISMSEADALMNRRRES